MCCFMRVSSGAQTVFTICAMRTLPKANQQVIFRKEPRIEYRDNSYLANIMIESSAEYRIGASIKLKIQSKLDYITIYPLIIGT